MPVWRFRTHDDARRALWLDPGDPRIGHALDTVLSLAQLAPTAHPPRGTGPPANRGLRPRRLIGILAVRGDSRMGSFVMPNSRTVKGVDGSQTRWSTRR